MQQQNPRQFNLENAPTQTFNQKTNKGFHLFHGDRSIGYFVIAEKSLPASTVAMMENPDNMLNVLHDSAISLKPFGDKDAASDIDALMKPTTA